MGPGAQAAAAAAAAEAVPASVAAHDDGTQGFVNSRAPGYDGRGS
jgi:hypothetical protein